MVNKMRLLEWVSVWQTNSKHAFVLTVLETGVQVGQMDQSCQGKKTMSMSSSDLRRAIFLSFDDFLKFSFAKFCIVLVIT